MIEILHTFAAGISFAVGAFVGGMICLTIVQASQKKFREDLANHYRTTEERLGESMKAHVRIAECLEKLTKEKP